MSERLIDLGRSEALRCTEEAERLQKAAAQLITMAEWQLRQAEGWQRYVLALEPNAIPEGLIPEQRQPERHLSIVRNEA